MVELTRREYARGVATTGTVSLVGCLSSLQRGSEPPAIEVENYTGDRVAYELTMIRPGGGTVFTDSRTLPGAGTHVYDEIDIGGRLVYDVSTDSGLSASFEASAPPGVQIIIDDERIELTVGAA
ncbi:hypothetical protein [Haloarchaeobius sp. FL176]|uniref:hypothetical protein n=1 Tax=Haloarchaeobius sp. FL176 TaxID=2967129 RepID=UPI002147DE41|nr:hypothetical protein [Haloarchaeobius sp. FL176]